MTNNSKNKSEYIELTKVVQGGPIDDPKEKKIRKREKEKEEKEAAKGVEEHKKITEKNKKNK